jgi:hypothetical protein
VLGTPCGAASGCAIALPRIFASTGVSRSRPRPITTSGTSQIGLAMPSRISSTTTTKSTPKRTEPAMPTTSPDGAPA